MATSAVSHEIEMHKVVQGFDGQRSCSCGYCGTSEPLPEGRSWSPVSRTWPGSGLLFGSVWLFSSKTMWSAVTPDSLGCPCARPQEALDHSAVGEENHSLVDTTDPRPAQSVLLFQAAGAYSLFLLAFPFLFFSKSNKLKTSTGPFPLLWTPSGSPANEHT